MLYMSQVVRHLQFSKNPDLNMFRLQIQILIAYNLDCMYKCRLKCHQNLSLNNYLLTSFQF